MGDLCNAINVFGRAVSNTARYRILEALLRGDKTVNELVAVVKLSQPAVSQHLKTLKASNLVIDMRKGQEVIYSVNAGYALELLKKLTDEMKKQKKQ